MSDKASRKVLLIICMEDPVPTGWTGKSLGERGEQEGRWSEIEVTHLDRINIVMSLSRPG